MDDVKEYVVKDAASYMSSKFKNVEVSVEGNDAGIYPENYDLCKKILPKIEELDEKSRHLLPLYFNIPVSVLDAWLDSSCWILETIVFGRISTFNRGTLKNGFIMCYTYDPPNSGSIYDCFAIGIKFNKNCYALGFEFGPIF